MKKNAFVLMSAFLLSFSSHGREQSQTSDALEYFPGELIVKFHSHINLHKEANAVLATGKQEIDLINRQFELISVQNVFKNFKADVVGNQYQIRGKTKRVPDLSKVYLLKFAKEVDIPALAKQYMATGLVEYAEPNYRLRTHEIQGITPNDPDFPQQWYLKKIQADSAWTIEKGDSSVTIGIIDTGVKWDHPDLVENIWHNPGEDTWSNPLDPNSGNGIDDDGNGYVDDWIGWNFSDISSTGNNNPMDSIGHGTSVAGIVGAVTNNNQGISGVMWNCQILALKAANYGDDFYISSVAEAISYAARQSVDVINMSFGGFLPSQTLLDAIDYAAYFGVIFVGSAGNSNSEAANYPAAYEGVINVAATLPSDEKASFSNYGSWIDICAPGVSIYSLNGPFGGTSASAPIVSGILGLVKSHFPNLTADEIIAKVIGTCDDIGSINPNYKRKLGAGRVNALKSLIAQPIPYVRLLNSKFVEISGNGNNTPDAGEQAGSIFSLKNLGGFLSHATIELFSLSDNAIIMSDTIEIGSGRVWSNQDHPAVFNISQTLTLGDSMSFMLTLSTSSITFMDTIYYVYRVPYQKGWPKQFKKFPIGGPPPLVLGNYVTLFDLNSDHFLELLFGHKAVGPFLYNGDPYPGLSFSNDFSSSGQRSGPCIIDPDHNGNYRIVFSDEIYNLNGSKFRTFRRIGTANPVSVADLEGDGEAEVLWASQGLDGKVYAWHSSSGTFVSGWPVNGGTVTGNLASADFDRDRFAEVAFVSIDNKINVIRYDGSSLPGFPLQGPEFKFCGQTPSPVFCDINNDTHVELIAPLSGHVLILNHLGEILFDIPVPAAITPAGLSVGDLDGDSNIDLVLSAWDGILYFMEIEGGKYQINRFIQLTGVFGGQPIIADIDNDGYSDVLIGTRGTPSYFYGINYDGTIKRGFPLVSDSTEFEHTCSLGDLDNDGDVEIVVPTTTEGLSNDMYIYVWDYPYPYNPHKMDWPMYNHDVWHSGNYNFRPPLATSVENQDLLANKVPREFDLKQNYPNPFNPASTIEYQLPKPEQMTISVYNTLGQRIKTLVNEKKNAGYYQLIWDGTSDEGNQVPSGVYLYRMKTGNYERARKMLLLR